MPTTAPTRRFRNPESIEAESDTRAMLPSFLAIRGFRDVRDERTRNGQTIVAVAPTGELLVMRVRICWRRDDERRGSSLSGTFSAAQLMAKIDKDGWTESIRKKVDRERSHGVTHLLFIQSEGPVIIFAALVPVDGLLPIWIAQRDTSERLISEGRLGRRRKNHAMNGVSPTLWLQDDRAPEVANELWSFPGVQNLVWLAPSAAVLTPDAALDDLSVRDKVFIPFEGDQRRIIEQQIRERRGQQAFRDSLRGRHGDHCLVTGCSVVAVLEAAHVKPYQGLRDNHPENGLLLRSDIHTLFDLDLLGIHPDTLKVELHPSLVAEYRPFAGRTLDCAPGRRPSVDALRLRYAQFQQRLLHP